MATTEPVNDFAETAQQQAEGSFFSDFWAFLVSSKKWWLIPVLVVLLFFSLIVLCTGTAVAPFIYTLF